MIRSVTKHLRLLKARLEFKLFFPRAFFYLSTSDNEESTVTNVGRIDLAVGMR